MKYQLVLKESNEIVTPEHVGLSPNGDLYIDGKNVTDQYYIRRFTEVTDKHGNDIYQGDIVDFCFKEGDKINKKRMEVIFESPSFSMKEIYRNFWLEKIDGVLRLQHGILTKHKGDKSTLYISNLAYWVEIVGNIYENEELLKAN